MSGMPAAVLLLRVTSRAWSCDLTLPHVLDWVKPVWHLYVVQNLQRDALYKVL